MISIATATRLMAHFVSSSFLTHFCVFFTAAHREWYAKVVGLDEYYPHEVGGHELLTLYQRNFAMPPQRTIEELELRDEIK